MKQPKHSIRFRIFHYGFFALSWITVMLFVASSYVAFNRNLMMGFFMVFVLMGVMTELYDVIKAHLTRLQYKKLITKENAYLFISVLLGSLATYFIHIEFQTGSVIASAIIGIMSVILFRKYSVAIFCGSFVGMSCNQVLPLWELILAGSVAGLIYVFAKDVFNGYGGKLGTTAFFGCIIIALLTNDTLTGLSIPDLNEGFMILGASLLGGVTAFSLNVRFKLGPVLASSIVGLIGGIISLFFFPNMGSILAAMIFCASFIGMSSKQKMGNEVWIGLACFIAALVFIYSIQWEGAGGKLGTIAFGSVLAIRGLVHVWMKLFKRCVRSLNSGCE